MTLLKKEESMQTELNPAETIRMEKFVLEIKRLAVYLGQFCGRYDKWTGWAYDGKPNSVTSIDSYNAYVLRESEYCCLFDDYFICLACGKGNSNNPYLKTVIETIFPAWNLYKEYNPCPRRRKYQTREHLFLIPYNSNAEKYNWTEDLMGDGEFPNIWRDDIQYPSSYGEKILKDVLSNVIKSSGYAHERWENKAYYNLFWNLFLLALDEDIYNEQLSNVIEFAHYLDFDEPMLRDWCRAVEYVMNGNKLSENCDFKCETLEGARFFLHKEYEQQDSFKEKLHELFN